MGTRPEPTISIGELKRALSAYPDDYELSFSGLTYYRLKQRAPALVQLEFNEVVYRNDRGEVVIENLKAE